MRDCVKKHRFMKPVKLFYLKNCPFCKKALRYIEEAKAAHPELAEVEIEMIEESEQPGVADGFDYYYVPTFYVDGEKVHEGGIYPEEVERILRRALGACRTTENRYTRISMEKAIAKDLLSIGAVFLRPEQPFTWASGIKSPIYCDNRLTLSAPEVRGRVEAGLAEIVRTKFPGAEVLMGTSTAGIAHAAITATILGLPMGYVRSGAKDHGRGNRIEGRLEKGQKVVVVEDLISTGGSCIEVVEALREAGAEVLGVASIFTYGMKKGVERLREANVVNYSLSNLDALVEVAADEGDIEPGDKARLLRFRDNPSDDSWMNR